MRNQPTREHHYVPRFYLREWCGDDGCLWRYSRARHSGRLEERRLGPGSVAASPLLHTLLPSVAYLPKPDPDGLEKSFRNLESAAAPIHQQLLARGPRGLSTAARGLWARFVRALLLRGKERFRFIDTVMTPALLQEAVAKLRSTAGGDAAEAARIEEILKSIDLVAHAEDAARRSLLECIHRVDEINEMLELHWMTVRIGHGLTFITSDNPVCLSPRDRGLGFVLPISPTSLFVATKHRNLSEDAFRLLVSNANSFILAQRPSSVVSASKIVDTDEYPLRSEVARMLVENRVHHRAEVELALARGAGGGGAQ